MYNKFRAILSIAALIGNQYTIIRGVNYGDIVCLLLLLFLGFDFLNGKLKADYLAKKTAGYITFLAIAGLLNLTFTNTVFINYSRNFAEGWIIYMTIISCINLKNDFRFLSKLILFYGVYFILASRSMLFESAASSVIFADVEFGYGRNNWGFSNLLLLMVFTYIIFKTQIRFRYIFLALFPIYIIFIYFSASRFSLITLAFFAFFTLYWIGKSYSIKQYLLVALLLVGINYFLPIFENTVGESLMSGSQLVLESKIDNTAEDGMNVRLMELNIKPIIEAIDSKGWFQLLLGDGKSITHGILSQLFISTGALSFFYFLYYHFICIKRSWRYNHEGKLIALIILVMLLNDFVTNARFIVGLNSMLYMLIIAYLSKGLTLNQEKAV